MKIVRLGMTESGILVLTFVYRYCNINNSLKQQILNKLMNLVNWLYTTSGYYDNTVPGTKFNFRQNALNANFNKLVQHLEIAVGECEETQMFVHDGFVRNLYEQVKDHFHAFYKINTFVLLNGTKAADRLHIYYEHMCNKRILVISSFSELCKQQYESGNVYKLGVGFPIIKSIDGVTTPYCFLNQGPHNNYFETLDHIFEQVQKKDFDLAVIGCGVYGHMLTHRIHNEMEKSAIYVGGGVTNLFGILSKRERTVGMGKDVTLNEHWITHIPESYRPSNFKDIEDGCYW